MTDRHGQTCREKEVRRPRQKGGERRRETERDTRTRNESRKETCRVGERRGGRETEKHRRKWGQAGRETQRHDGRDGEAGRETRTDGDTQRQGGERGSGYPTLDPGARTVNEDVLGAPALPTWPPAFLVTQTVKHLSSVQEIQLRSLGREDPLEQEMATHSSTLAWKIPWTEEPGGLWCMGRKELDMTERLHFLYLSIDTQQG